jgi:hypothetical protein
VYGALPCGAAGPLKLGSTSLRADHDSPELTYPFHHRDIVVTACGRVCLHRWKINISTVFAGQTLGIREVDDGIWLVSFIDYDLGHIDLEQRTLQFSTTLSARRLSPMGQILRSGI